MYLTCFGEKYLKAMDNPSASRYNEKKRRRACGRPDAVQTKSGRNDLNMKRLKKLALGAVALIMAAALSACSDTSWVFDYSGEKIPAALYIAYTMTAYQQIPYHEEFSSSNEILKQTLEGKDATAWIKDEARKSSARYAAVLKKWNELEMSFTEEEDASLTLMLDASWANSGPVFERNGVSKETYRKLWESSRREEKLFTKYYDKDGIEEVKNEDLMVHFQENFASVAIFRMALYQGDDLTEAQLTENERTQERAQEYVEMLGEGRTFGEIYDLFYHDEVGASHDAKNEEDVIPEEDSMKTWVRREDDANYPQKVTDTIFNEMKPGDSKYIVDEDKGYYYIVKRFDMNDAESSFDDMRTTILQDVKGDDFEAMVQSWTDELTETVNQSAVRRYNPKNIVTSLE